MERAGRRLLAVVLAPQLGRSGSELRQPGALLVAERDRGVHILVPAPRDHARLGGVADEREGWGWFWTTTVR